jgi:uncharacterized membrane protein YqiK
MKKSIKVISIIFVLLALILVIIWLLFIKSAAEFDVPSISKQQVVNYEELNSKLYLCAKAWGISGNHEEIVLSSTPIQVRQQYSKDECFVYYTSDVYYKKQGTDTLLIYASESGMSKMPVKFISKIKVVQIGLKNNSEEKDYNKNYKKYGLSKISTKN